MNAENGRCQLFDYEMVNAIACSIFSQVSVKQNDNDVLMKLPSGEVKEMNKTELIAKVAELTDLSKKDASKAVDAVFDAVSDALQGGDKVQLVGFGNFEVKSREARKGRNPQTGQEIDIPASKIPTFKAGKSLKDLVSK